MRKRMMTFKNKSVWLSVLCLSLSASYSFAQVTSSGSTVNTIPLFTGTATLGNSLLSQSGTTIQTYASFSSATVNGQSFFVAHQVGGTYGYPSAMFSAITDNTNGTLNTYFSGTTGTLTNFYVRADGLLYTEGPVDLDGDGYLSSMRSASNNYTNLFLGGAIADAGTGNYTVITDGGSNYFGAIRMDNAGGNVGAINFYTAQSTGGSSYNLTNAQLATYQRMTIVGGNVGIGTAAPGAKLEVAGNMKLSSGSGGSLTFQDGSVQTVAWNGVLSGGDYAESVDVTGERTSYEPGDVLVVDPGSPGKMKKCTEPYSMAVAGIYSTNPGVRGRRQKTDRSHMPDEVPLAMVGIVPTKVTTENGAIKPGDVLVTSKTPGFAMRATDRSQLAGAIVGKAMGALKVGSGVIEVLVTLQ